MDYLDKDFDAARVKDECIEWIRRWFEENGNGCKAVIGISGGKDSSTVAALCVEALGRERVLGILMPQGTQPDIWASKMLVKHLGIEHVIVDISPAVDTHWQILQDAGVVASEQARINLPARMRMLTLYAVSQSVHGRVANTCNLSEDYIGYATRWGDAAGDFSPLTNLTVGEVKAIGRELGLPDELVEKEPSDGLCGKADEDNIGFLYAQLDRLIRTGTSGDRALDKVIKSKHESSKFKLEPIPAFEWK